MAQQDNASHAASVSSAVAATGFLYRPDVDGLRTIAVALVLLYHAGLGWLGGFIGVDIFFVISGFLITGVIISREEKGTFRFADFWARRFRRLAPALLVIVFGCLIAGAFILWPDDYEDLAMASLAQQAFAANIYFWQNTGYFDGAADMMPLLHTWSLAVEEQFYFVYPFLLVLFWRTRLKKLLVPALFVCVLLSLAVSAYGVHRYPSASFYLLPTRAWELGMGGLLFFLMRKPWPRLVSEIVAWAGLLTVLLCGWFYTSAMPFPGITALWPCLGTLAIIAGCAAPGVSLSRVLALKPMVVVGQMSYALYLVHWPILVFTRHVHGEITPGTGILCLVISFVLSYLLWVFIETPIRHRKLLPGKTAFITGSAVAIGITVAGAAAIVVGNGFVNRYDTQVAAYLELADEQTSKYITTLQEIKEDRVPVMGDEDGQVKAVFWGDSHAMALVPGVDAACIEQGIKCYRITRDATPPILDYAFGEGEHHTDGPIYTKAALDWIIASDAEVVLIAGHWSWYARASDFSEPLQQTVDRLVAAGKRVALVQSVPIHPRNVPKMLAQAVIDGEDLDKVGVSEAEHLDFQAKAIASLHPLASEQVTLLDPAQVLRDEAGLYRAAIEGIAMYVDEGHLSINGGLKMTPLFSAYLASQLPETGK